VTVNYSSYLKVDELLTLQCPLSDGPEHDEMLFIVIHQVYELWFKQILHEMGRLEVALGENQTPVVLASFNRILTILKTLVGQVDILETMTPIEFTSFRARLEAASGFQSAQFRKVEFALGLRQSRMLQHLPPDSDARKQLEALLKKPSLFDRFLTYLTLNGFDIPKAELSRDFSQAREPSPIVQDILEQIYRERPDLTQVCERLVDLDEGIQEWRYRHVKMVERTIGSKTGTGGSAGVGYLKSTLFRPFFPDLWAVRARF